MASVASLTELDPIRIGPVEIRPATREVLGPAGRDVIEPRVMQVLVALIGARGEVVTRDQLVRDCWGGRAVSEDAINRAIQRIRRIGEGPAAGSFEVKTIHKVGYRLLAASDSVGAQVGSPAAERQNRGLSRRAMLAAAILSGAGLSAPWLVSRHADRKQARTLMARGEQALRLGMPPGDAQAASLFAEAARLTPNDAHAWGRLALARTYVAEFAPASRTDVAVGGVQDAARRALALDPREPDALAALAILPPFFGDWLAAERRMKAVLAIAPDHLPTRDAVAFMYTTVGRVREGCEDRVRMAALDPFHATYQFKLIYAYWLLGRLNEADRAADRAVQLWPKHPGIWWSRFNTYALTGRAERAIDFLDTSGAQPALPLAMVQTMRLTAVALASGDAAVKKRAGEALVRAATFDPASAVMAVTSLNGLGEIDRAFAVAEAYLLERGPLMASVRWKRDDIALRDQRRRNTIMLFIPSSAAMRADPRFASLVEDVGLVAYWRGAAVTPDYLA